MHGAIPPLPQYASMAWFSVKNRDNFTFYHFKPMNKAEIMNKEMEKARGTLGCLFYNIFLISVFGDGENQANHTQELNKGPLIITPDTKVVKFSQLHGNTSTQHSMTKLSRCYMATFDWTGATIHFT
jgi:hypothetical protein